MLLYKATEARNLPVMLEALAHGADPNWVSGDDDSKTPIMKAVETVSERTNERTNERTKEGRKEMFYLTTHSTHFTYGYMASDI